MPLDSNPPADDVLVGLIELLREFMGLSPDQIVIYNSDWRIPSDTRLYITVGLLASKVYGTTNEQKDRPASAGVPSALIEQVIISSADTYTVNVFSVTNEAMLRNWEVIAALSSTIGQQAMERLNFGMSRVPASIVDLSGVEGARRLFRYANTITLLRSRVRENVIQIYDDFTGTPALVINP